MTSALKKAHEAINRLERIPCRDVADEAHAALDAAVEEGKASTLQESGYWLSPGKMQEALAAERERVLREVAKLLQGRILEASAIVEEMLRETERALLKEPAQEQEK